ncbi:MAG: hypothetical protein AB7I41_07670 [Candidatus Sericytochromatia bacterium]
MDVLARLLSSDCSAPARYQHLQAIWAHSESRQRLLQAFLSVPIAAAAIKAPALVEVGLFLLSHLSRRRNCREAILDQLLHCPSADADLLDWLTFKLERRELRLKVAAALLPRHPERILAWVVAQARWPGSGPILQGLPPDLVFQAFLKRWLGGNVEPVIAHNLIAALPWSELRPRLYAQLEFWSPWVQAGCLQILGYSQDPCVYQEFERWLALPYTPVPLAALGSLSDYPRAIQVQCLTLALDFRCQLSGKEAPFIPGTVYQAVYWKKALMLTHELKLAPDLQRPLLELLPVLYRGIGSPEDGERLVVLTVDLLLIQPSAAVAEAIFALIDAALARQSAVSLAYKVVERLNRHWPDWPLPVERVIAWLEGEVEWARRYAQDRTNSQADPTIRLCPYVHDFQHWFFQYVFEALALPGRAETLSALLPALARIFLALDPQRSGLNVISPSGYDPGQYDHWHLIGAFLRLFKIQAQPDLIHILLDTFQRDPLLNLPADAEYDLIKPPRDPGWFEYSRHHLENTEILEMASRHGNAETLAKVRALVEKARPSLLKRLRKDQWRQLKGALARLESRWGSEPNTTET